MDGRTGAKLERWIGIILRAGVVAAALVVLLGGVLFLGENAARVPAYRVFDPSAAYSRGLAGVIDSARRLDGCGVIQLGLLLLIATPVIRVVLSAIVFAVQRDIIYVAVTGIVLAVLVYGFVGP